MLIVRPVALSDLDAVYDLAVQAGDGMTSLSRDKLRLTEKIEHVERCFRSNEAAATDVFWLVLECTERRRLAGIAGLYARTGSQQAFYAYRVSAANHYSHSLQKEVRSNVLHLTNDYTDCSEVGTLFVHPDFRGNGAWLARARYQLMASFRHRFADDVIAEIRGYLDERGQSPFWEAIGRPFFEMDYAEADHLCSTGSNQFITELMPKYPIYTRMLPETAQQVIGVPHQAAARARQLLEEEGFHYERVVDIFDGGPMLRARTEHIRSLRESEVLTLQKIDNSPTSAAETRVRVGLFSNLSLSAFRACRYALPVGSDDQALPEPVARALNLEPGMPFRRLWLEK